METIVYRGYVGIMENGNYYNIGGYFGVMLITYYLRLTRQGQYSMGHVQ